MATIILLRILVTTALFSLVSSEIYRTKFYVDETWLGPTKKYRVAIKGISNALFIAVLLFILYFVIFVSRLLVIK